MKRGGPLPRYTELRRTGVIGRSAGLTRYSPINRVSAKRRADQPERKRRVNALREKQAGRCARCGQYGLEIHGHERIGMAHGASYVRPDVAVCNPCNTAIEDDPPVSAWCGWKISSKHPHDPALQPWEARALDGTIVDFSMLTDGAA